MATAVSRRAKGEGTIRQVSDKLWRARISLGINELGKRDRKDFYGKTRPEVMRKLRDYMSDGDKGIVQPIGAQTLGEFFDAWMLRLKDNAQNSTYDDYERVYRLHIKPHLGKVALIKISHTTVEAFHRALHASKSQQKVNGSPPKPLGERTKRKAHNLLSQGLDQALKANLILRNPCDIVDAPKYHAAEMKTLTMEQLHVLLNACTGTKLHAICCMGAFCGLREGEAFALTWADIDFKQKRVNVRRSARNVSGATSIARTKTKSGKRGVIIPGPALESLIWWKSQHRHLDPKTLVFPNAVGKHMSRQNFLRRDFHPLLAGAQLPRIRFHDLRHSVATYYLSIGVNPKVVQEILGHSHVSTTLAIYSHALPTMQDDAADLLAEAFHKSGGGIKGGNAVSEVGREIKKP
jgi:integrase